MFRVTASRLPDIEFYACSRRANLLVKTKDSQIDNVVQPFGLHSIGDTASSSLGRPEISSAAFYWPRRARRILTANLARRVYSGGNGFARTNDLAKAKNSVCRVAFGILAARDNTSCSLVSCCARCLCLWLYARDGGLIHVRSTDPCEFNEPGGWGAGPPYETNLTLSGAPSKLRLGGGVDSSQLYRQIDLQ
jgi:hypothetical protein